LWVFQIGEPSQYADFTISWKCHG